MLVQSGLLDDLAVFYQQHGTWNGVEEVLSNALGSRAGGHGQGRWRPSLILADSGGRIVYDEQATRTGNELSADEQANALPIILNGRTVGSLMVSGSQSGALPPAAQSFLDHFRTSLVITALAIGSLGMLLSLLISRAFTAPLAHLTRAARAFAARNWTYPIKIGGTAEVNEVGHAFRDMARELERTERMRRDLVADIAHELR